MENFKCTFATRRGFEAGATKEADELVLVHDCGSGLYIVLGFNASTNDWTAEIQGTANIETYEHFKSVVCSKQYGACELVALRSYILWERQNAMGTGPFNLKIELWLSFFLIWQRNIFDAESGKYRNTEDLEELEELESKIFMFTKFFSNTSKVDMSKSAIQTFVQKPFAKDVPTWERLQVFFENAELPNDENHLENEEQVYLFPGQDKAVSSQEVSNIYNLIKRSKAQNLAAWPQQEASTASVGGSLLHLGLSLALGNPEQEVIPELRGQYSDSVNPLQLCLLNVLLKSLNSKYTFGDAAASEKSVLSAVPYIFGPNMMTQFKCVDDSLTFRSGENRISMELKTRWADGWDTKGKILSHLWQSSLQAFVASVHRTSMYNPALLMIKIPPEKKINHVWMHYTDHSSLDEPLKSTLTELFREVSNIHRHKPLAERFGFCNGRVLFFSSQKSYDIFKKVYNYENNAEPKLFTNIQIENAKFPFIRCENNTEQTLSASSFIGPRLKTNDRTFKFLRKLDIKVYKGKRCVTFQHNDVDSRVQNGKFHDELFNEIKKVTVTLLNMFVRAAIEVNGSGTENISALVDLLQEIMNETTPLNPEFFESVNLGGLANTPNLQFLRGFQLKLRQKVVSHTFISDYFNRHSIDNTQGLMILEE